MPFPAARLSILAAALALGACASTGPHVPSATAPTVLDAWASRVQITPIPEEIRLAAHPTGLSGNQARALSDFHLRWMQAEGGLITIASPSAGPSAAGAYRVGADARAFLLSQGAPADQVRIVGYEAGEAREAPVVVGFQRYVAVAPTCGDWANMTRTFTNEAYGNFGCAVSSNLAAQVANPEDLLRPRTMTSADPLRRGTVLDKYRKGETTSTAKDDQASGAVSQAIQ